MSLSDTTTTEKPKGDEYVVPPLGSVMAFRGVHALSDIMPNGFLRASHYATCLIGGREPMWGVWSVNGVFQRFFGSRSQVAEGYPRKVWRMKSATWNLIDLHNKDAQEKKKEMREIYKRGVSLAAEPVAALFEDGSIVPWAKRNGHKGNYRPLVAGAEQSTDNVVHFESPKVAAVSS